LKYTSIFIAHRRKVVTTSNVLRHGWHITCKLHHACLYSPAAEHHYPLAGTHFTIIPQRVEGWVDLGGWLHTEIKCCLRESNLGMVTHPSTNRAQHKLTSLTKTKALPLCQTATHVYGNDHIPVGVARALAYSSNFGLLGSKVHKHLWSHALDADEQPSKMRLC